MSFEALVDWLHGCRPKDTAPQWGAAGEDKVGFWWSPGKHRKPTGASVDLNRVRFLGTTNRCYRAPSEAMHSQDSWITWAGLDIDWSDQTPEIQKNLVGTVARIVGDQGSLRRSCGGKGLHVFFRFDRPVIVPANSPDGTHTPITRAASRPWRIALEAAGVHICKDDSRMFWVCGGKNEWVYQTEKTVVAPTAAGVAPRRPFVRGNDLPPALASDEFVRDWLNRLGARPGLCYVGDMVSRLRALGERVTTRSPCSGNGRPNGYIDVAPGRVSLWTYADGATIWAVEDVERTLETMMDGGTEE